MNREPHFVNYADAMQEAAHEQAQRVGVLEKALEQILVDPPPTLDEPDADWEVIEKYRAIAREALADSGFLVVTELTDDNCQDAIPIPDAVTNPQCACMRGGYPLGNCVECDNPAARDAVTAVAV